MDWSFENLTPEERERLAHLTEGLHVGGFFILMSRFLKEPPPESEPYTPIDVPPSPYIPLALRLKKKDD